jgi:hypothetical protein
MDRQAPSLKNIATMGIHALSRHYKEAAEVLAR